MFFAFIYLLLKCLPFSKHFQSELVIRGDTFMNQSIWNDFCRERGNIYENCIISGCLEVISLIFWVSLSCRAVVYSCALKQVNIWLIW